MFMGSLGRVFSEWDGAGVPQGAVLAAAWVVMVEDDAAGAQGLSHPLHGEVQGVA